MTKKFKYLLFCSLFGILAACSQEPATPSAEKSALDKPVTTAKAPGIQQTIPEDIAETANLKLFPENPQSGDCLKAIVSRKKGPLVFEWRVNGEGLPKQTGDTLCDVGLRRGDQVEVRLAGTEIRAERSIGNSLPRILDVSIDSQAAQRREDIRIDAVTDDADGDIVELRCQWFVNDEEDLFSTTAILSAERYRKGDRVQIRITPFDGNDEGETYVGTILTIPNAMPQITSQPPEEFASLEYGYTVRAIDPDDDKLSYRLDEAPTGMTIDEAGQIHWSLAEVTPGTYSIKITVEDTDGGKTTQAFSITLAPLSQ